MDHTLGPFNLVLLALPGVALKVAVRIMYGRRQYAASDPLKVLLTVASTLLLVLAGLGGTLGIIGIPTSLGAIIFLWLPILCVVTIVTLMVIDRSRHAEHRALVWSLATAAQRGIPLPEAARAFADETQNDSGARALVLAQAMEQGLPLSQAARQARLRLSVPLRLAIRLGEALGMLGPAMRQQLGDAAETDVILRSAIVRLLHVNAIIIVAFGVLTFVMLQIVPVFQRMFAEFGLELPPVTILLIDVSNLVVQLHAWLLLLPLLLLSMAITVLGVMYFIGWAPRDFPLVWRLFRRYDGALTMRGLALAVRRGVPLTEALDLLAAAYPIRIVGSRLETATIRVAQGADWRDSLRRSGLIAGADAAVLAAAERAGNLPWALEEMADSAIRRQAYRLQLLVQILYPAAIILLGTLVAFVVIGLFAPLLSLIQGLS
jgi:type II secretory pathway component PulF